MMKVLQNGQTKFQIGDNENLFDFTYIGNSAYSHILAAERLVSIDPATEEKTKYTVDGEVFIITNGQPVYFWDFPRAIWAMQGHVAPYTIKLPRDVGVALGGASEVFGWLTGKEPSFTRFRVKFSCWNRYFNIKKAQTLLGYEPIWDLHEGLVKSVKWFEEEAKKESEKKGQ